MPRCVRHRSCAGPTVVLLVQPERDDRDLYAENLSHRWSAVPLRLTVGYGFLAHGYAKVVNGPDVFAASLHALGVPAPHAMAWATIGIELVGGLAILLGAWIPVISVPLATILLVAAITVHWHYGFNSIRLLALTEAGPTSGPTD